MKPADRIEDRRQQRTQDGGVRLLLLVDRLARQAAVVEQDSDRRAGGTDGRARDPAAARDARLSPAVLDDRAVVEHREVPTVLLAAAEDLAIGVADLVHDLVFVDDAAPQVGAPRPQHQIALAIDQEDGRAVELDALMGELHGAPDDRVRFVQRQELVERRQQVRELPVQRSVDDVRDRNVGSEDQRPVDAPALGRHPNWSGSSSRS